LQSFIESNRAIAALSCSRCLSSWSCSQRNAPQIKLSDFP
jgi:hypothetical protein